MYLEIPVFSPSAAREVASLGADRIELNAAGSYAEGGLTPQLAELSELKSTMDSSSVRPPIRVMIRPRGAPRAPRPGSTQPAPDFVYTDDEFAAMRNAIITFKESKLLHDERGDGFVFGILEERGMSGLGVHAARNRELVGLASPYPCVFHRAFDDLIDPRGSGGGEEEHLSRVLDDVVACGFDGILTSGGPGNAPDNTNALRRLVRLAEDRIQIVMGGGVRSGNAGRIITEALGKEGAGGHWLHSSCLTAVGGGDRGIDAEEVAGLLGFVHRGG